jgi:NAD(P)-dependent dehydrogenase (short-subunit alcohol dehydrogenase family)
VVATPDVSGSLLRQTGTRNLSAVLSKAPLLSVCRSSPTIGPATPASPTQLKDVAIDVLIISAGIAGAPGQKTGNVDYESWADVLNVDTVGPLRVLESFIDHIARNERRMGITITSGMGSLTDNTSGGSIAYRSSKAAVNMVMRSAAIDLGPRGIACVLLNPCLARPERRLLDGRCGITCGRN